jgi:hypothetical protein
MYDAEVNKQVPVFYSSGPTGNCMTAIGHPVLPLQCNTQYMHMLVLQPRYFLETFDSSDLLIIVLILRYYLLFQ